MIGSNRAVHFFLVESGNWKQQAAEIIVELPVSITVNGETWLTFMCTPTDLEALAIGFLFNEKIIDSAEELASVRVCPAGDNIDVWLTHNAEKPKNWKRTSGCTGGVTAVDTSIPASIPVEYNFTLPAERVGILIGDLFDAQELYRTMGGVHTSALSDGVSILVSAEDVGRHNTLDKIAGRCLLERLTPQNRILLTTGRISSEMLQKAARIGAPIAISRTSPTSLSVQMAEQLGITLIGYARRTSFKLYTHPDRIIFPAGQRDTPTRQETKTHETS